MSISAGLTCVVTLVLFGASNRSIEPQSRIGSQHERITCSGETLPACREAYHVGSDPPLCEFLSLNRTDDWPGQVLVDPGYYCNTTDCGCYVPALDPAGCPYGCPKNYDPVCASDGKKIKTFANLCYLLKAVACKPKYKNMRWINDGKCVCDLQKDPGPCLALFPRYYYDLEQEDCLPFNYGGCLGNGNRFKTYEKCLKTCTPDYKDEGDLIKSICGVGEFSNGTCVHNGILCIKPLEGKCPKGHYCCGENRDCEPPQCTWEAVEGKGLQTGPCSRGPVLGYTNMGQQGCGEGCNCYILNPRYCMPSRSSVLIPKTRV